MNSTATPLLLFYAFLSLFFWMDEDIVQKDGFLFIEQNNVKEQAFSVLRKKCNVCHATKKKTDIFTLENMDSLAADINKQVFVKRKMPKGRKVKLTEEERNQLKAWLGETLIEE